MRRSNSVTPGEEDIAYEAGEVKGGGNGRVTAGIEPVVSSINSYFRFNRRLASESR